MNTYGAVPSNYQSWSGDILPNSIGIAKSLNEVHRVVHGPDIKFL